MKLFKLAIVLLVFRPLAWLLFGIATRVQIPRGGPALVISNHNSHLDSFILMSLLPIREMSRARLVVAADYFLRNRLIAFFYSIAFEMIPIQRKRNCTTESINTVLLPVYEALDDNAIVIFFPEGTRGEAEVSSPIKKGIAHIAERFPKVPIVPISFYGLGKALPKGESFLVPFSVDIRVGSPLFWTGERDSFLTNIKLMFESLASLLQGDFIKLFWFSKEKIRTRLMCDLNPHGLTNL